ncbi:Gfo/Idh/MocA family oxidoreductase [Dactylosporangium sp. AC04546]|uniref:Gfo/Idh/MocA family protein n=1 Tax=Dactylosporangium sp. AC04546 TaxID=2862460 RepID=UPI001EE08250|nr:Gfo/Idh/MocA family oxidoreductase [Dactylosporangium sp. AC04546]WVK86848.1 Gfo/Idh/MocA family oxidoreductase [Dactylosporangium sp. AC04546]
MTSRIRVGVIGTGTGTRMQIPAFIAHPAFEVTAVCSADLDRAREVADRFDIAFATDSEDELAASAVDLVSVATPPTRHASGVRAALRHRKHVMCEKPFAPSVAEASALLSEANEAGVRTFMNFEFRHAPGVAALRRLLDEGRLGEVRYVCLTDFTSLVVEQQHVLSRWWFSAEEGGGWLNAHGTHRLDLLRHLFGDIASVGAVLRTDVPRPQRRSGATLESTVDDGYAALIQLASGATVVCFDGAAGPRGRGTVLEVVGDRGLAVLDGDELRWRPSDGAFAPLPDAPRPATSADRYGQMFARSLDDIAAAIRDGDASAPSFVDGLRNVEAVEAARDAAVTGGVRYLGRDVGTHGK